MKTVPTHTQIMRVLLLACLVASGATIKCWTGDSRFVTPELTDCDGDCGIITQDRTDKSLSEVVGKGGKHPTNHMGACFPKACPECDYLTFEEEHKLVSPVTAELTCNKASVIDRVEGETDMTSTTMCRCNVAECTGDSQSSLEAMGASGMSQGSKEGSKAINCYTYQATDSGDVPADIGTPATCGTAGDDSSCFKFHGKQGLAGIAMVDSAAGGCFQAGTLSSIGAAFVTGEKGQPKYAGTETSACDTYTEALFEGTYCLCKFDKCNSATSLTASVAMVVAVFAALL